MALNHLRSMKLQTAFPDRLPGNNLVRSRAIALQPFLQQLPVFLGHRNQFGIASQAFPDLIHEIETIPWLQVQDLIDQLPWSCFA